MWFLSWYHRTVTELLRIRIIPISAHAAFDKGAAYMGIKVHTIPVHPETRQVDIKRVARAINPNTILVRFTSHTVPERVFNRVYSSWGPP